MHHHHCKLYLQFRTAFTYLHIHNDNDNNNNNDNDIECTLYECELILLLISPTAGWDYKIVVINEVLKAQVLTTNYHIGLRWSLLSADT